MLKFYPRGGGAMWHVVRQRYDIFRKCGVLRAV